MENLDSIVLDVVEGGNVILKQKIGVHILYLIEKEIENRNCQIVADITLDYYVDICAGVKVELDRITNADIVYFDSEVLNDTERFNEAIEYYSQQLRYYVDREDN